MEECVEDEPPDITPFFRAHKMEQALQFKRLFIKFEGQNVTGTQKDRISKFHVMRARDQGFDTISLASCGNYGVSISHFAKKYGLNSVVAMPDYYSGDRVPEILANGGHVLELPTRYEDSVEYIREKANRENWYDSNPGGRNSELDFYGYSVIASEIIEQLGRTPEFLAVPMGNGTTVTGIYRGFRSLHQAGMIDTLPRIIGSSTDSGNPIVSAWKKKNRKVVDLSPSSITETHLNEPLVSYVSYDGQPALDSIYESNGYAVEVSDMEMLRYSNLLMSSEKISALPASCSAIVAAHRVASMLNRRIDCVVVLTGRRGSWKTA